MDGWNEFSVTVAIYCEGGIINGVEEKVFMDIYNNNNNNILVCKVV